MTSNVSGIFSALDAAPITFTFRNQQKTPTIKTLSELPNTINGAADLPMRLLLSMDGVGEGQSIKFTTLNSGTEGGGNLEVQWQVTDLMLLIPQAQGSGFKDVADTLVSYMGKYVDMVRNKRNLTEGISITNVRLSAGTYMFPGEGGTLYFGVQAILDLLEIVS